MNLHPSELKPTLFTGNPEVWLGLQLCDPGQVCTLSLPINGDNTAQVNSWGQQKGGETVRRLSCHWRMQVVALKLSTSLSAPGHLDATALLPLGPGKAVSHLVLGLVHWESWEVRASGGGPESWLSHVRDRRKATLPAVTVALMPGSVTASPYPERERGHIFTRRSRP